MILRNQSLHSKVVSRMRASVAEQCIFQEFPIPRLALMNGWNIRKVYINSNEILQRLAHLQAFDMEMTRV